MADLGEDSHSTTREASAAALDIDPLVEAMPLFYRPARQVGRLVENAGKAVRIRRR